jgi:hypothetical protein
LVAEPPLFERRAIVPFVLKANGGPMTSEVTKAKKNRPSRYRPEFDKVEAIADAVIESDRMDCTARYLVTGRRFANLETEEIKRRWTEATRNFLIGYGAVNPREMDDLSSELHLRKAALPHENVRDETAAVARRIEQDDDPEGRARIRDRIRSFRDDLEKRRN